jgi:CheY-like chemotaxis protein
LNPLPIDTTSGAAASAVAANSRPARGVPQDVFRILLVDDNPDANEAMAMLIEMVGYPVRSAGDGASALTAAGIFLPHLVVCDIGLPGMSGYELVGALRAGAGDRKLVIAAVTGYGHESDRNRSLASGFDHHLVKPLDADALLDFIAHQAAIY